MPVAPRARAPDRPPPGMPPHVQALDKPLLGTSAQAPGTFAQAPDTIGPHRTAQAPGMRAQAPDTQARARGK